METGLHKRDIFVKHNGIGIVMGKGKSNFKKIQNKYPSVYINTEKRGIGITLTVSGNIMADVQKAYEILKESVDYAHNKLNKKYRYKKIQKEKRRQEYITKMRQKQKQLIIETQNPELKKQRLKLEAENKRKMEETKNFKQSKRKLKGNVFTRYIDKCGDVYLDPPSDNEDDKAEPVETDKVANVEPPKVMSVESTLTTIEKIPDIGWNN